MVFDGFSAQVFVKDLAAALSGQHLPPLQYQYADFTRRQRAQVEGSAMTDDIAYWRNVFSTIPEPTPLFEFSQVVNRRPLNEYTTHVVQKVLSTSTVTAWKETVRQAGTTPFHGHLAVVQLLLSRFLSLEEICIGITDANRTDSDFLDNIGFFVNLLPLRFKVDKQKSFAGLLQNTRDVTYQALQHSRVPFDVLLDSLAVPRSTTESPLFQILINYKMGSSTTVKMPGLDAQLLQFKDASNPYDLVFDIEERTDGTTLIDLKSQSHLYSQDDLTMLLNAYSSVLASCTESPTRALEKHCLYSKRDVDTALSLGTGPNLELDETITLTHRIDHTIAEQPHDLAIKDNEGRALTYSQMGQRIHSIAATLLASGTRPGDFVAVYCEPSLNSVCYLLAIWRLNATYVPLDPQNPVQRLQLILNDCQPKVLIYDATTEKATGEFEFSAAAELITFSNFANTEPIPNDANPSSAACALYTSGSTGVPKGIVLTHTSFSNQILGFRHQFSVGRETVLQQSSLGFDVSLDQMLQPLVGGGTLVVAPRYLRGDAVELARLMASEKVSYTYATPSEYAALLRYAGDVLAESPSWRFAVVGGEALPPHLIRSFHALSNPALRLINRYGPTEITVSSSCLAIDTWEPAVLDIEQVSVGYSLPNYATYIFGPDGSPLPVGYAGEIVIAGRGVAQGYLGKEDLTRERFLVDSLNATAQASSPRMYRTGDKGRFLPNGELMYLGRVDGDTQIKLRGFRVELADIGQTILRESGGRLADAVISVRGMHDGDGDRRFLLAFAVPAREHASSNAADFQLFLNRLVQRLPLPPYMLPRQIVVAADLPRNPNGKLDRRALDQLPLPVSTTNAEELEKLTPAQEIVVDAWGKCLNPSSLPTSFGPSADFFELGGNSLLMIRLQALLNEAFGQRLPLRDLFQSTTVQGMAARFVPEEQLDQLSSGIDWEEEITVGATERSIASSSVSECSDENVEVCLTGATGFLGTAILRNLVADSRVARIHCLAVRSFDPSRPRTLAVESEKIIAYPGDLALSDLGLDRKTWDLLASKAMCIIHNGADVSFLKTYQSLRKSNLQSTRELTKLALIRGIPFHFVSSGGVAQLVPSVDSLGPRSVRSYQPPTDGSMGYIAAKWASEAYLESCALDFNLPVSIHRPSSIVGEGVPPTDLVHTILDLSLKTNTLPTLDSWGGFFDFVPVEDVAAGICQSVPVTAGADLQPKLQFIHHCADEKVPVAEIGAYFQKTHDVELNTVDVGEWLESARKAGLSGALDDLVTATFQGSERHFMPSLAK
ncbi:acetyl-CoA synthetase-like protein [Aspergillus stella-maris]|uniref:acetyl-CoA synthetase-like protein n=1 Tax=Aspergillus stella-maris TaxID=1810926 RepID=UPI003CCD8748